LNSLCVTTEIVLCQICFK